MYSQPDVTKENAPREWNQVIMLIMHEFHFPEPYFYEWILSLVISVEYT